MERDIITKLHSLSQWVRRYNGFTADPLVLSLSAPSDLLLNGYTILVNLPNTFKLHFEPHFLHQ